MKPNDQSLCIVPGRSDDKATAGQVLPFEGGRMPQETMAPDPLSPPPKRLATPFCSRPLFSFFFRFLSVFSLLPNAIRLSRRPPAESKLQTDNINVNEAGVAGQLQMLIRCRRRGLATTCHPSS